MGRRNASRWVLAVVGCALVGGLAEIVSGWIQSGPTSFSLPNMGDPDEEVWNGPDTTLVGVTVSVATGKVKVLGLVNGTYGQIGPLLTPGAAVTFEGKWEEVKLHAMADGTTGTWLTSYYTAPPDQRVIGFGDVFYPATAATTPFFMIPVSEQPSVAQPRFAIVHSVSGSLTVTDGTTNLVQVEPDDWTFCAKTTKAFAAVTAAQGEATYRVYDEKSPCGSCGGPYGGMTHAQSATDKDYASVDGTVDLTFNLTNTGTNGTTVTVTYRMQGQNTDSVVTLDPQVSTGDLTGHFVKLEWTYSAQGGHAAFTVTTS